MLIFSLRKLWPERLQDGWQWREKDAWEEEVGGRGPGKIERWREVNEWNVWNMGREWWKSAWELLISLSLSLLLCVLLPVHMAAYVCERIKMKEKIGCKVTDTCHHSYNGMVGLNNNLWIAVIVAAWFMCESVRTKRGLWQTTDCCFISSRKACFN